MQINARLNLDPTDVLLQRVNLNDGGAGQRFVDATCIRMMDPYTPYRTGALMASVRLHTVIGSGQLVQDTPYARYQYYGEIYGPNIPIKMKGVPEPIGWWSPPHKSPTGRMINYSASQALNSSLAGSHWFERMAADHKQDILNGLAAVTGGKAR